MGATSFLRGKIWLILLFFALGWIGTGIYIYFHYGQLFGASRNFLQDVFTAWCGELAFFTIIGLAATVISIEKPEDPRGKVFEERVNILFGHQRVPQAVLEHNRNGLISNARYSSGGWRKITLNEYTAVYNAYSVTVENVYFLNNAIADFDWIEKIEMDIKPDKFADLAEFGAIKSIKINGNQKIEGRTPVTKDGFSKVFEEASSAGKAVKVEVRYEIYMVCDRDQTQSARRFAESITLEIFNEAANDVPITFADKPDSEKLQYNKSVKLTKTSVLPGGVIVSFKLAPPAGSHAKGSMENAGAAAPDVVKSPLASAETEKLLQNAAPVDAVVPAQSGGTGWRVDPAGSVDYLPGMDGLKKELNMYGDEGLV